MSIEELREILYAVVELTKVRQSNCAHLMVENFAPELFAKMVASYSQTPTALEPKPKPNPREWRVVQMDYGRMVRYATRDDPESEITVVREVLP